MERSGTPPSSPAPFLPTLSALRDAFATAPGTLARVGGLGDDDDDESRGTSSSGGGAAGGSPRQLQQSESDCSNQSADDDSDCSNQSADDDSGEAESGSSEGAEEEARCTSCWCVYPLDDWWGMSDRVGVCAADGHESRCEACVRSSCMLNYWAGERWGCRPTTVPWPQPTQPEPRQTSILDYFIPEGRQ